MARIVLFANTTWYLYNFRLGLARAAREAGHEVILVGPPDEYGARLGDVGFQWIPLQLRRRGLNPVVEAGTVLRCARLYRRLQPDLVHHTTIKAVVYGTQAARLARVPRVVNSISGLGYAFVQRGLGGSVLRTIAVALYRAALRGRSVRVVFENESNLEEFVRWRIVQPEHAVVIPGTGVDLAQYTPVPEPEGRPVVLLASRMLWIKGIGNFIEAARMLKQAGFDARFMLAGGPDPWNPSSIPETQLRQWATEGLVEWLGQREDMPAVYAASSVVVLPSQGGEGVPRTLVEAAASGRPIVTSDVPGCRDVVRHGVNGLLVPAGNPQALAEAIGRLLSDSGMRREMGKKGRVLAERELGDGPVNAAFLRVYAELLESVPGRGP